MDDQTQGAVKAPLEAPVRPRCGDCKRFYVPVAEPQWRYIGGRVGECTGRLTHGLLRPPRGWMIGVVEDPKRPGWLKGGGGILVDADFGCVNFERPNVRAKADTTAGEEA
jgi:hypothetical protein